ncbi:hypothetical protein [Aliamphritea spongicola]|uniref:hypothetical protein n=1 Tax=Aliamphritea spongicola TaxID=707589 RepID=UPI00196AE2BE|nr:hypothetical protein [Aliamphritea spongicola]MBN3564378.1 hypothetical protein [Aliamphritea spongicola]
MLSLNTSSFHQALNDLVQRLVETLQAKSGFARYAGHGLHTLQGTIAEVPLAPKSIGNAAKNQLSSEQACGPSGRMIRINPLPASEEESECETINVRSRLEALFRECQPQADSRDMTFTLFGEARVTAPLALVDTLLTALLHNGLNFGEEFVQFRLSGRGLQMLNPVSGAESGQGQDGHGLEIVRDICKRFGWQLSYGYRKQVFVMNISFQHAGNSLQHSF